MKAYSQDLRERVLNASERGESPTEIAQRFEVSDSWVGKVIKRFKETGVRSCLKMGGHIQPRLEHLEGEIRGWIAEKSDMTLEEMVERLSVDFQIFISVSGLWYQLERWDISLKKNHQGSRASSPGRRSPA